jgi:hypothetical protein
VSWACAASIISAREWICSTETAYIQTRPSSVLSTPQSARAAYLARTNALWFGDRDLLRPVITCCLRVDSA